MASFAESTHCKSWLLTEDELRNRREKAYDVATEHCAKNSEAPPLTIEEQLEILDHHERRTVALARQCNLPRKVAATMCSYLKRFYVDRSVMLHNPSVTALIALYTASKIEEPGIFSEQLVATADSYLNGHGGGKKEFNENCSGPSEDGTASRVSLDVLLKGELRFLQALDFHLVVYHPYRSLTVVTDMLNTKNAPADEKLRSAVLKRADHLCTTRVLHSDIVLTETPAAIATAATLAACRTIAPDAADDVLAAMCETKEGDDSTTKREAVITALAKRIDALPKSGSGIARLAELEKKRLAVRDEEMDATTDLYRRKQAEEDEEMDKDRREDMKRMLDNEKQKAEEFLLRDSTPPRGSTKRSRFDAQLDGEAGANNSPERKRLSMSSQC